MAFSEQYTLATTQTFIERVTMAMIKSAEAVNSEAPATVYHDVRVAWATQCLRNPQTNGALMTFGVTVNPSISESSTDADIEFTVNSIWNAYAGVVSE